MIRYAHLIHINGELGDADYEAILESKDGFQLTYNFLRETHNGDHVAKLHDGEWYLLNGGDPRPFSDICFSDEKPQPVVTPADHQVIEVSNG